MDQITNAIIVSVAAGIATGTTDVGKKAVVDAYIGLKEIIKAKYGRNNKLSEAIKQLESKPDSKNRKELVKKEVNNISTIAASEVSESANELLKKLKNLPEGEKHIQIAEGNYIAQADSGGIATVSVNQPMKD